ncbi:MAG: FkbM family methyltransferase [Rhodospirillales bacterium]|nr:FkbM family methyltransferase [Rhodospirillales bacterium]
MELLTGATEFARLVAGRLDPDSPLRLVDVGCSGGIDEPFRAFGERLSAWGFDIDGGECARLQAAETFPKVRYIAGRVGLPEGHPFLVARAAGSRTSGNPWDRLSVAATQRYRQAGMASGPAAALPELVELGSFFVAEGIRDLDFLKIDVDGEDFAILSGLEGKLATLGVLGVGIEVNFYGTDNPTDHTLHNVDRFMRQQGYDLFGLSVRHYSAAALPARYAFESLPAQGRFGRPLQGDALTMRDLSAPTQRLAAAVMTPAKLAKAAAIFSLADLPDCAAEVLITFRDRLAPLMDVDAALDLLTEAAREDGMPTRYRDYLAAFAADAACFYQRPRQPESPAPSAECPRRVTEEAPDPGAAIEALKAENAALRQDLDAMRASRSWRITALLCRARDAVRLASKPRR